MIIVYYSYINGSSFSVASLGKYGFPQSYLKRLLRFRNDRDALLSIHGRLLLKNILNNEFHFQLDFESIVYNRFGKPFINKTNFDFSISHASGVVVCAVSDEGLVGVDLERVDEVILADYRDQMTDFEWTTVVSSPASDAFFNYWTQKESVLKAAGTGLSTDLKSFEIISGKTVVDDSKWFVLPIELRAGYVCHLAGNSDFDSETLTLREVGFNDYF
ncbi:4'-phosphopantetheinyl transferase superfamily protein [Mucilaginibacter gossypii]|uniref:4'-phosphopantetheinyl transferase family protein n=1 Tax=Mucilaginibacter gossypii TaxID=551996 RepID=UPI000DCD3D85|nr:MULTISPECIES: 4'-phosphopantetheinyl transferase superfamily protein [Mucilaginibacter]QTE39744.1 4'-phosphopantetheinyl transferase superfamily protein [Mucilaginibacter gossypii]RAV58354.1 hypothetical protein DIU36_10290 [Mucilaginibacter rubeus]